MKKVFKLSPLLLLTLTLSSCDWFSSDDDVSSSGGTGSAQVTTPGTSGGSASQGSRTENASWYNYTNGGRPTWYFSKSIYSYPSTFYLDVFGCKENVKVTIRNGRWEAAGRTYVLKQSEWRGTMGLIAPSSCSSKSARIRY